MPTQPTTSRTSAPDDLRASTTVPPRPTHASAIGQAPTHATSPLPPSTAFHDPASEADDQVDLALIRRIRAGDAQAWHDLLARHHRRIFAICLRMTGRKDLAEDLVHDAIVRIMRGLSTFDSRARLSTWLTRVTMNVVLTRLRSERYRRHASLDQSQAPDRFEGPEPRPERTPQQLRRSDGRPLLAPEHDTATRVQFRESVTRLSAALAKLSDEHRAILLLRDAHNLDYEAIAHVLSVPVGTVKSRLFRARLALRDILDQPALD